MKLEFLSDLSDGEKYKDVVSEQLIRLYDFDSAEAKKFQMAVAKLAEIETSLDLNTLAFVSTVNCSLELRVHSSDEGIHRIDKTQFVCSLTRAAYEEMIILAQVFVDGAEGYQWLSNHSDIDFLFSPGGSW